MTYPTLQPKLCIGSYELIRRIGSGGQGEVWLVQKNDQTRLIRAAKISLLPWDARSDSELSALQHAFEKETETLKRISNSHVVTMHDFEKGQVEIESSVDALPRDYLYQLVAMEFSRTGDMSRSANAIQVRNRDSRERIQFLIAVASGLRAIHADGVQHCDIKPSNILLFEEGDDLVPKISDFGAAQLSALAGSGNLGTLEYMAPEVNDGQSATFMSDIFSLGVTFHELVTGALPNSKDPADLKTRDPRRFYKSVYSSIDYAKESLPESDSHLRPLIQDMLAKEPLDRPTAADIVDRLRRLYDSLTRTTITEQRPTAFVAVDTYLWNPEVHKRLGERMHFFYLHNLTLDSWNKIKKRLNEKLIFNFSIHRVIGETDFILRGWFPDVVAVHVRELLAELGDDISIDPQRPDYIASDVLPRYPLGREWAELQNGKFREWLKRFEEPLFVPGTSKEVRASTEAEGLLAASLAVGKVEEDPSRIRVFLKIFVTNSADRAHSQSYSKEFDSFFGQQREIGRICGAYFVWRIDDNSTFIIEFRLSAFSLYRDLVVSLAAFVREKNLNRRKSQFNTSALLELDPRGVIESDDGEITNLISIVSHRRAQRTEEVARGRTE